MVEALRHGKAVLARDIPVFREIATGGVSFFPDRSPTDLVNALPDWLQRCATPRLDERTPQGLVSWRDSCEQLRGVLEAIAAPLTAGARDALSPI